MAQELHRGKLARHPRILSVRPLVRDDLVRLQEKRVGPPRIKKLRRAHHIVAKLISAAYTDAEISKLTGYSGTRIQQLRVDPAMQELVAKNDAERFERIDAKGDIVQEEMIAIKLRTLSLVHDFLDEVEESDDRIPIKTILPIVTEMADRTGHGKHSSSTNVSVNFAEMMKESARKRGRSNVIDAQATLVPSAPREVLPPTNALPHSAPPAEKPLPVVSFRRRA